MTIAVVAEVAWYVTGRFYTQGATLQDVGYFLHLQGVGGQFPASESQALLTFAAVPFTSDTIDNGGLTVGIAKKGTFHIYLRDTAGATFDDPQSFATGTCIATFTRVSIEPTVQLPAMFSNVFTARLVSSQSFELDGVLYDFKDLVGDGVTQWGTAAVESSLTPPSGYSSVVPFVGSAIRIG